MRKLDCHGVPPLPWENSSTGNGPAALAGVASTLPPRRLAASAGTPGSAGYQTSMLIDRVAPVVEDGRVKDRSVMPTANGPGWAGSSGSATAGDGVMAASSAIHNPRKSAVARLVVWNLFRRLVTNSPASVNREDGGINSALPTGALVTDNV